MKTELDTTIPETIADVKELWKDLVEWEKFIEYLESNGASEKFIERAIKVREVRSQELLTHISEN